MVLFRSEDMARLEKAAKLSGSTHSAFIKKAAIEKAQKILDSEQVTRLNQEDWETFMRIVTGAN